VDELISDRAETTSVVAWRRCATGAWFAIRLHPLPEPFAEARPVTMDNEPCGNMAMLANGLALALASG